ncbi:RICIN domain-containing protein [Kitasatospora sp. NBC_01287]|uniref:RICIN domain-containing protein n=1 Tax=Kitasatospora sp. NBC_01287 TaxID=2903573 RepID=UPI002254BBD3|nr:RICIN domain-containing protein [Kitasatospora sp. NBC_01287]MCX4748352.1 RICIN domain-containing protein [Kitasatospora sp. NBC_01287]
MIRRFTSGPPTALLAVAALVATLGLAAGAPQARADTASPRAALPGAIVSLGDSAISGEGAGTDTSDGYFAGTDGPKDYCHRHPQSEIFDTGLSGLTAVDLACSGAQTGDLVSDPTLAQVTGGGSGDYGEPKQDAQLAQTAAKYDVKMVVVTIGANDDFDFSGIMESCLGQYFPIPQSTGCRDTIGSAAITQRAAKVIPKVTAAITDVRDTMRTAGYPDGSYQLVFQSYFTPITPDIRANDYATKVAQGCPAFPEDLAWGHNWVVPTFDDALRQAAEAVPGVRFLDQRRVSYGHEVCAEWTTSPYEYTNGDVIDLSENTRNGCDFSIGILSLCENEIRQSYHLRVAGYHGEGNCLAEFYDQPGQQEAYCTLDQGDGTTIMPLTPGQPFGDGPEDGAWYQLTNTATGQVLDLSGGGTYGDSTNGRLAINYPADGGLNQSFVLEAKPGGSYELDFSGNRNMCLDATGGATATGTRLEQWSCNGGGNQHWVFEPAGNARYKLADSQNTAMVATASADHDGQNNPIVELAADTGASAQLWQLTKLGIVYLHS